MPEEITDPAQQTKDQDKPSDSNDIKSGET